MIALSGKNELLKRIGNISQIADAREGVMSSGRADGVRVIDVRTGGGLNFTVLPTRGLDIAWAEYKGTALSYIGKPGVVHPAYFEKDGLNFLRGFFCGLLTTCGLTYCGAPCDDNGEALGLHGRISNIPAENVCVEKEWIGATYKMTISGKVSEAKVFGENLVMRRKISTSLGAKSLDIEDRVENIGFEEQPLMLLYHCNFGYPIVSEDAALIEPEGTTIRARDSAGDIARCRELEPPTKGYGEQVFYHSFPQNAGNDITVGVYNKKIQLGTYVRFRRDQCTRFGQWKMMGESDYVLGLEPANCLPEGRAAARERKELDWLKPGEVRQFNLTIGVAESEAEIKK